jgi:hypothetical protein
MSDLTIDTQILVSGSGKSNVSIKHARELLDAVKNHKSLLLAVDDVGHIIDEYHSKLGRPASETSGCLALQMLAVLYKQNRVVKRRIDNNTWKPMRLALGKLRFDHSDHKFVRTAAASESRRLVAHEKGYTCDACSAIKKVVSVVVESASSAFNNLP